MGDPEKHGNEFASRFEAAFARLQVAILEACEREAEWPQKMAAAVRAGLELAAADPDAARALTSEALGHGRDGIARYERLLSYLGERLAPGREERPGVVELPEFTERSLAGGILGLVAQRVDRGRTDELPALAAEVVQFGLTPFLGGAEARRVGLEVADPGDGGKA